MKYLKIKNDGVLDIKLLSLMGGTTKDENPFKIGQWGSGLKYSISYLLKNNIYFKIFIDGKEVEITTKQESISDSIFDIIYINNERTSLALKMGGNDWKPWTIIRELWCNALDAGGEEKSITEDLFSEPGTTVFFIQMNKDFQEVLNNWNHYFMHGVSPVFENEKFKIYPSNGTLRIFKQGVLIHESKSEKRSLFNYDIKNADINELREFRGSVQYPIYECLSGVDEKTVIHIVENITEEHYESTIDFYSTMWWGDYRSPAWDKVLNGVKIIHQKALENLESRGVEINYESLLVLPKNLYKWLNKTIEGIGALRFNKILNEFFEIHDEKLIMKVKKATTTLEACSYFLSPELKFVYGIFGDKQVNAKVDLDEKTVYISESIAEKSLFQVCSILIEENEHFKTGFSDCSRSFQQHFIDLFLGKMLEKEKIEL